LFSMSRMLYQEAAAKESTSIDVLTGREQEGPQTEQARFALNCRHSILPASSILLDLVCSASGKIACHRRCSSSAKFSFSIPWR
jgi:hypothetical protein